MKKNLTEMVFILDRSGSMAGLESDTVGGFNSMIGKQRLEDGEALVSTVLFNDRSVVLHDRVSVRSVMPLTQRDYFAGGSTALLDAVGFAVKHIKNIHKYSRPEDVPERTVFIITTDGMENASRYYSADEVRRMIKQRQKEMGWEFLFLGANIDAVKTAEDIGIREERAANFNNDSIGTALNYDAISYAISDLRVSKKLSDDWKKDIGKDFIGRKPGKNNK